MYFCSLDTWLLEPGNIEYPKQYLGVLYFDLVKYVMWLEPDFSDPNPAWYFLRATMACHSGGTVRVLTLGPLTVGFCKRYIFGSNDESQTGENWHNFPRHFKWLTFKRFDALSLVWYRHSLDFWISKPLLTLTVWQDTFYLSRLREMVPQNVLFLKSKAI